jgi:hypothetical protein
VDDAADEPIGADHAAHGRLRGRDDDLGFARAFASGVRFERRIQRKRASGLGDDFFELERAPFVRLGLDGALRRTPYTLERVGEFAR